MAATCQLEQRWIMIPKRGWHEERQSPSTINLMHNSPLRESRNLVWFANKFGFKSVDCHDVNGKNIFHHLFTSGKYCIMSAEVALGSFRKDDPKLPGDYSTAMSHKVTGATPIGWTPLHVLLHGSDVLMIQRQIIEELLDSKIVEVKDFDSMMDSKVIVFGFCLGSIHPFRGRTAPSRLLSHIRGSTGTYVRSHMRTYGEFHC